LWISFSICSWHESSCALTFFSLSDSEYHFPIVLGGQTWHLHENKRLKDIVDPTLLGDEYSEEEAMRVVDVALHCTQSVGTMRPTMTRVVELLTHGADAEIPEVTGSSKPRLFTLNNLAPGGTTLAWSNNNSKIDSKHDSPPESEEQEGSRASIPSAAANLVEPR
jgi:hypothetical protein